jgi:sec-independent protein translocase protein TatC
MASADELGGEQGFLTHLVELRDRLLKMLLSVCLLFIPFFIVRQDLFDWLAAPLSKFLPPGTSLQAIDVASSFFIPFKLVFFASLFVAMPAILYQIWAFVAPGLYKHEKRLVRPLFISSVFLFYLGVAFAYYVVFPLAFKFFVSVAPESVDFAPDIARYLSFVLTIFFAFGLAFEVPIATVLVVMLGITTPDNLVKMRPYVFVIAFVIGMFLTPPDIISQTLLAIPMWFLFEVGIVFSRLVKTRVKEAGEARDAMHEAEAEADEEEHGQKRDVPGSYKNSLTDHLDDQSRNPEDLGP